MDRLICIPLWIASMGWHLWRMLTARPAYKALSDTRLTALSFLGIFLFAGWLRFSALGQLSAFPVLLNLLIQVCFILFLAERRNRSSGLTFAYLGISAGIDLVVCAGVLVSIFPSVQLPLLWNCGVQAILMLAAYVQFRVAPSHVRSKGYRASNYADKQSP